MWRRYRQALAAACALLAVFGGGRAQARDAQYTVLRVDPRSDRLALFLDDEQQQPLLRLKRLDH